MMMSAEWGPGVMNDLCRMRSVVSCVKDLLVAAVLLSCCCIDLVKGLPNGAPIDSGVCNDLTPLHGSASLPCPADVCDFRLSLISIDGEQVPTGHNFYRCGAVHKCEFVL